MIGIADSSIDVELSKIKPVANIAAPIVKTEYQQRIGKAIHLMGLQGIEAMYLHAGTNLLYFTGIKWNPSERMVGAILFQDGELHYIAPKFELGTIRDFMVLEGRIHCWEEHESPFDLFVGILKDHGLKSRMVHMDETTPFFVVDGVQRVSETIRLQSSKPITSACRMVKSNAEIDIIQCAMDITLKVQKATARVLREGMSAKEVTDFIDEAHKRYGVESGSFFCIVLFGLDTSFPHGVRFPKDLEENDMVIIDTGCMLHNYISDITRTYVYGIADAYQRKIWNIEKEVQKAAFNAAKIGHSCEQIDQMARNTLEAHGLGPGYALPGVPHRTGHGIGLDIHERPYIVKSDTTLLQPGMCFSNEPMICVPGKFGIRFEDHMYMTEEGPKWFTEPMYAIDDPFGIQGKP